MTQIQCTVFGASGKVGQILVSVLVDAGYSVVAFTHRSNPFAGNQRVRVVRGDIHDNNAVRDAIRGSQVVLSTLGSWGTHSKDIVSAGTAAIIPAMQAEGIKRIITVTGQDARTTSDQLSNLHRITHTAIQLTPAAKILVDGERHIALLESSDLDWTALRSPVMNGQGDAAKYVLTTRRPAPWATINRRSVALAIRAEIDERNFIRQAPFLARQN